MTVNNFLNFTALSNIGEKNQIRRWIVLTKQGFECGEIILGTKEKNALDEISKGHNTFRGELKTNSMRKDFFKSLVESWRLVVLVLAQSQSFFEDSFSWWHLGFVFVSCVFMRWQTVLDAIRSRQSKLKEIANASSRIKKFLITLS